ncbi:MAG: hypothetical protein ACOC2H_05475 [Spirochaetota bacterium]
MKRLNCILTLITVISTAALSAQEVPNTPHENKLFQFSLFHPIGTDGSQSDENGYTISVNILYGETGSVEGVEAGGLVNQNRNHMHGVQYGGLASITREEVKGLQYGGLANVTGGPVQGLQIAGLVNTTHAEVSGVQAASIVNVSCDLQGVQLGSIVNAAGNVDGIQLAALVNRGKNVRGVQIAGLVNSAESLDGIPIGLVNFVRKDGKFSAGIGGQEYVPSMLSLRSGVRYFYTILSVGYNPFSQRNAVYGGGFGTEHEVLPGNSLAFEGEIHNLTSNFYSEDYAVVGTLRATWNVYLTDRFSIYAGPTRNILGMSSNVTEDVAPSRAAEDDGRYTWWGGTVGVQSHF